MKQGFDKARLAKIGTFLKDRYIDPGLLPMVQASVMRHGKVVFETSMGLGDRERGTPLRDDAIFRIYSMTKPITSIAFMMLVEEGKVALDDPVTKFIPAWKDLGVYAGGEFGEFRSTPATAPMRMVDLLRHTSGLSYRIHDVSPLGRAHQAYKIGQPGGEDLAGAMAQMANIPLHFEPGSAWNYSVATDVVGYLVGLISGMPYHEFLEEKIFKPLGMVDTAFHVREGQEHRFVSCYRLNPAGQVELMDDVETSTYLKPTKYHAGGAGLVSTRADYLQFCRMLLGKGALSDVRLISPKTLALMTANHLPDGKDLTQASIGMFSEATYAGVGFGLGFATTMDPHKTLLPGTAGDYFWGGMASTFFWIDPKEDIAVVLMTQLAPSNSYPIRRQLRTLVYSALVEPAA